MSDARYDLDAKQGVGQDCTVKNIYKGVEDNAAVYVESEDSLKNVLAAATTESTRLGHVLDCVRAEVAD